ncbi:MAG: AzlD domain-containing protein [Christensenellales bacterium]
MKLLIMIAVIAIVSYLPRVLPFVIFRGKIKNTFVKSVLNYMPYGILSAMIFPAVLYCTSSIWSALVGFVAAILASWRKLGLLPVALISTAAVFAVELIMKFCC